jgi:quinol monooxygenase YgiN
MDDLLVLVDTSEIRGGKIDELRDAVRGLAEFVEANEVTPIAYHVYFSDDGERMTVVQLHPDSASMELHMQVAGPVFARFADLVELQTVDVYGSPSDKVVEQLRAKAELLGTATVSVHDRQAGFIRLVFPDRSNVSTEASTER